MAPPPNAPEASVTDTVDAGSSLGNEIGLGNLSTVQYTPAGQGAPALPGSPLATTSLLSHYQANLAAVMRSGQVLASGAYDMHRAWAEASAASLKDANDAMAALTAVRCVKDLVDVQSSLVRSAMDKAFTRSAYVASSSMRLTHQALEPISARISSSARAFVPTS